jgi:hypothetical protein
MKNTATITDKRGKLKAPWKKGESGNPNGRPPIPKDEREILSADRRSLLDAYHKIFSLPPDKLKTYKPQSTLESGIHRLAIEYQKTGNLSAISRVWDRLWGKPKTESDINLNLPLPEIERIKNEAIQEYKEANRKEIESILANFTEPKSQRGH